MKRLITGLFLASALLHSCSDKETFIFLKTDHVHDLSVNSPVAVKGFEIGKVKEIDLLSSGEILLKLELQKEITIPSDSRFVIQDRNLFGSKEITVEYGQGKTNLQANDTITANVGKSQFELDVIMVKLQKTLENLSNNRQEDSILSELRRLNKNLEAIKGRQ